jgi:error-prone DNA polymerase
MRLGEQIVEDYRTLALSLKSHPLALVRGALSKRGALKSEHLAEIRNGQRVRVAGLTLVRQRPGTASGVIFMTLEDETGIANIVVWPKIFEQFRPEVLGARLCAVQGRVQSESGVIHVVAEKLRDWSHILRELSEGEFYNAEARATENGQAQGSARGSAPTHPRNLRIDLSGESAAETVMPKGRNFH